ncbi:MAG: ADP-glyceromanno-heptose 6-epimerase [Candidatus Saelkia tenebricola]|nr:ADP-glyceromanno-heptose 6-epimerase [Candidatus Saelkia tenebricola]
MSRNIVVTGGAGFIGSAVVWGLNCRGIENIWIVDLEEHSNRENISNLKYSEYIPHDVFRNNLFKGIWDKEDIDCIIHLGACTSTMEKNEEYLKDNNYQYTVDVAQFSLKQGIRFIYASSAATYGDGSLGFSDDESKIEQFKPLNLYGESKQWFDMWVKKNNLLDKIVGLKYFNVYGPNEYHKEGMRSFIIKAYEQIKKTGRVRLFKSYKPDYEDGEQLRDFIYVKDVVDETLFFFDNRNTFGIYNVGTGSVHSWNELVNAVFESLSKEVKIEYIDMPAGLKEQYQYFTQADMGKIKQAGYIKEPWNFKEAIADYVLNYLQKKTFLK